MRKITTRICTICDKEFSVRISDINRGRGKFCSRKCHGLAISEKNNPSYKHGNSYRSSQTREYKTWTGIKQRTTSSHKSTSKYYWGRNIKMCDRWLNSFTNFLEDMGKCPGEEYSIDRINNDGDYEPGNCRWATRIEQMNNTRSNKIIEFNGEKHTQEEWGRIVGISGTTICKRLRRGWSIEKALTTKKMINQFI